MSAFQTKTIRVNDVELAYIEQGTGDALVLVHGGLGDFRSFMFQIEPLAQRYHVIAYSRRYHFPNQGADTASNYSATAHRDDLAALIEGLHLAPAHVVGSSYGAYISLLLALARPALVHTLVLGEPPAPFLLGTDAIRGLVQQLEPSQRAFSRGESEEAVRLFIDSVTGRGGFDRLPPPVRQAMLENASEFQLEVRTAPEQYFASFTCEGLKAIKAPTLLLTGETSPIFFHQVTDVLERCLPNVERAMIPHASHGMHNMNPQSYNQIVLAFLGKH